MVLEDYIRIREDWPKQGISFKDITPLLQNAEAFEKAVDEMVEPYIDKGITKILCADARGFIFGSAIAYRLHAGLSIARKPNKLPYIQFSESYSLEYGTNTLEVAPGSISDHDNILIVDDLLATGGSANALTIMVRKTKANLVGYSFLIELTGLNGRKILDEKTLISSVIKYEF